MWTHEAAQGVTNSSARRGASAGSPGADFRCRQGLSRCGARPGSAIALLGLPGRAELAVAAAARVMSAGRVDDDGAGGRVDRAAGEGRGEERQGDQCFHGMGLSVT